MDGDLHFPGVEAFRQSISRAMESAKGPESVLVVDVKKVNEIDYTALKVGICMILAYSSLFNEIIFTQMINSLAEELHKKRKTTVSFVNISAQLRKSIGSVLHGEHIYFLSVIKYLLKFVCFLFIRRDFYRTGCQTWRMIAE